MKYSWQFDPLEPDKPVELTCDGTVIATTSLKNAQELANKLNSHTDLYEALKAIQAEGTRCANDIVGTVQANYDINMVDRIARQALAKVEEVQC